MKNYLRNYLLQLSRSKGGQDFRTVICRYGKFTIYCIIGPEENILQVTFAPECHLQLQKQLQGLNPGVVFRKLAQKKFYLDSGFARYFSGKRTRFSISADPPLIAAGTVFQKKVWHHIGAIPYGASITYQKLAELAGSPKGARAAGLACGANPLALIIPCHRVVAVHGLGGFTGGLAVKRALLALEHDCTGPDSDTGQVINVNY